MPRREVPLVAGECYHVYNRGHNRQDIFFEEENYLFFLRRLKRYLDAPLKTSEALRETSEVCTVVAYCLMPNHFHLLLQPHDDDLSHHLQLLTISYTKAINQRRHRIGALFQGAFQARCIDRDEYLLHLSRYIHLNPVQAGLTGRPEDWPYSSYRDYLGLRNGHLPRPDIVLSQFPDRAAYRQFVDVYVSSDSDRIAHLLLD
ncbi:MAG TPA: transposase [Anaerolineae bacterium]